MKAAISSLHSNFCKVLLINLFIYNCLSEKFLVLSQPYFLVMLIWCHKELVCFTLLSQDRVLSTLISSPQRKQANEQISKLLAVLSSEILFYFVFLFRAAPTAYGSSRASGQIGAIPAGTETQDPSHVCDLHHSSQQCWIPNPQSKARD